MSKNVKRETASVEAVSESVERAPAIRHVLSFAAGVGLCGAKTADGCKPFNEWIRSVDHVECVVCADIARRMGHQGQLALHRFWGGPR